MKGGARIALGVGLGYLLGRTKKMRFAMTLAGAAMARRSAGTPAELLERGTELLKSTPELTKVTDTVRDELLGAVRSAAVTAASNRIDALSNRLQQGATLLEDRGGSRATDSDEDEDDESSESEEPEPEEEDEEQAPEDEYEEEDEEQAPEDEYEEEDQEQAPEDEDEEQAPEDEHEGDEQALDEEDEEDSDEGAEEDDTERPAARARTRRSSTAKRGAASRTADRSSDSTDRKPSGTRGRRTRAEAGQAPVRRTRG